MRLDFENSEFLHIGDASIILSMISNVSIKIIISLTEQMCWLEVDPQFVTSYTYVSGI